MKKKRLLPLGILAVLVLATLIYTRPMTLQEIGKVDIAQCESVSGYHRRAPDSEFTSFELSAEDERCSQLIDLFAQQKYRRSLINLLSASASTRPISLTAAPARACLSPAGTFLASCRFSALTTARPSAAPQASRRRFCSRSMTSFPLNRNPFHTLSQQEELL